MNLQQHMEILAHDVRTLAFRTKVDEGVIQRALAGLPITNQDAKQITRYIGQRFGHPHNTQEDYQIDGLKTV